MLNVESDPMRNASVLPAMSISSSNLPPLPATACSILLIAVNARYSHSSYAARTLKANMQELEEACTIIENDLSITPIQLASRIIELNPEIAVFSTYIWNVRIIEATASILEITAPHIKRIAGGPELTADYRNVNLFHQCIIGEGETALRNSCRTWLENPKTQLKHLIEAPPENINKLKLPFALYNEQDIRNRVIYVEASRGCPYHCSYCTSSGTGLRLIPLETLLPELDKLWQLGLRQYKFLDRSFAASMAHSHAIMEFFLDRYEPGMCLHFEINTDHLKSETAEMLARFPPGALHLECGIQTLNPKVAVAAGRSLDTKKTLANLKLLTTQTGAIIHADLIFGLPGEDEGSFAKGFDKLQRSCQLPELQINLLKGLPGTELTNNAEHHKLKFNPEPPYELIESANMDFRTLMKIQRFARCWELIHNRGRFPDAVKALNNTDDNLYERWTQLADFIYNEEGRMFNIGTKRLQRYLEDFLGSSSIFME
ncbi:MAG: DUF4080 domain-containing protein [Kiritimatiellae bacterium]|jgi:radical SAM superfamily enzyme YgiQ (UPF0313 family)|nr:DUF4080 domain-containing protein [Kiritimatiellia bacterium]